MNYTDLLVAIETDDSKQIYRILAQEGIHFSGYQTVTPQNRILYMYPEACFFSVTHPEHPLYSKINGLLSEEAARAEIEGEIERLSFNKNDEALNRLLKFEAVQALAAALDFQLKSLRFGFS